MLCAQRFLLPSACFQIAPVVSARWRRGGREGAHRAGSYTQLFLWVGGLTMGLPLFRTPLCCAEESSMAEQHSQDTSAVGEPVSHWYRGLGV